MNYTYYEQIESLYPIFVDMIIRDSISRMILLGSTSPATDGRQNDRNAAIITSYHH